MRALEHSYLEIRSKICDAFLIAVSILAIPTLAVALYRIVNIGWLPVMALHIFFATTLWPITLYRKHLPYNVRAGFLLSLFIIVGFADIWTFGLVSASTSFLVIAPLLGTIFFSMRSGIIILSAVILTSGAIGMLTVLEHRLPPYDLSAYVTSQPAWWVAILVWSITGGAVAVAIGVLNKLLIKALEKSRQAEGSLRKSEESLITAQRIAKLGNWDWNVETGKLWWSDEIYRIFGLKRGESELTYEAFLRSVHPDDRAMLESAVGMSLKGEPYDIEHRIVLPGGEERIVYERGEVTFDNTAKPVRMLGTVIDITERNRIEQALLDHEEKLRSIIQASNVTAILSIDDNSNLATWNPGAEKAFGYSENEILGKPLTHLIPERYRDAHTAGLKQATETGKYNVIGKTVELAGLHKNGHEFPLELSLGVWEVGELKYFSAVINDITERKQAEKKIHQLAYTDHQTGLPNEASFLEQLNETLNQNRQGFVASIELSGIGDIVGTFGLEASELIFYELGKRLSDQMNEQSVVARVGPRLFKIAYVVDDIKGEALKEIAAHIFKIAQQPFDLMGSEVTVNAYMGVSIIDVEKSTAKSILTDVEIAQYEAMKSAAGCIVYFRNSIKEDLVRSTQIVSWLHSAIENNVFKLFFQPQVSLKTNTIVGCEALIRWPMSTEKWISPGEFIPIAEKAGLIGDITKWTVDEACCTAASWIAEQGLNIRVGVNISAEELASPNFLDYVSKFIEKTKLPPEVLEIEITETALMKDVDVASKNLNKLRDMGASVAIDDFGTGQASLAYLKKFPIDRLKIDQSFVKGAPTNKTDREIIASVIKLAHSLGMDVIAEGAEEKEHIDLLVALGCDEVQGYYIAKPMPADQFVEFVNEYS